VIRVLLADDQVLVRSGFRALLSAEDDIEVVAEAGDGAEAVRLCLELEPDVVLMDIRMPGTDGLMGTRQITDHPELDAVKVLVLTTFEIDEYVYEALRAGASGFLVKHTEPEELIRAVRVVAAGAETATPPRLREAELLTQREREVIKLVAEGLSNDEIAEQWVVSNATVRTHVSRAMTKLRARDRALLVVIAYRHGLA
jgi:DNA-binding NarL/FixJ family response regulator